jgi:hypothetical protein
MDVTNTNRRTSTAIHANHRSSSKRSHRTRPKFSSTNNDGSRQQASTTRSLNEQPAVRNAGHFADRFDKWDMYELLATRDSHWLLTNADVYKVDNSKHRQEMYAIVFRHLLNIQAD